MPILKTVPSLRSGFFVSKIFISFDFSAANRQKVNKMFRQQARGRHLLR